MNSAASSVMALSRGRGTSSSAMSREFFDVLAPRTISRSRITLAGEKKCMPSTGEKVVLRHALALDVHQAENGLRFDEALNFRLDDDDMRQIDALNSQWADRPRPCHRRVLTWRAAQAHEGASAGSDAQVG